MRILNSMMKTAAMAALAGGLAFAQAPNPDASAGQPAARQHTARRHGRHRGNWRQLMAGYLNLTPDQQTKAKAIFAGARESAQPIRQQLRDVRTQLRAAVREGEPVDQLAVQQGSLSGKLTAIRAGAMEQFRGLLTPDQVQKLDQLHTQRQPRG